MNLFHTFAAHCIMSTVTIFKVRPSLEYRTTVGGRDELGGERGHSNTALITSNISGKVADL
jgi:hypothetical protein